MHFDLKIGGTVLLGALFTMAGCSDPCMELAKIICSCEPSMVDQQGCDLRLDAQAEGHHPTKEQKEVCSDLIDQCTCEKLAAGEYAACGLAP